MVVGLSDHLARDDSYLGFLTLVARSLTQALGRTTVREAERGLSEALQRSLLSQPIVPNHLEVAVRYQPAAEQAQIGGDWYDAFLLPDGSLTLVVGDVTGHDRTAAAAMAQVRNLLRGVSYTLQKPPARVLKGLDEAMRGLAVDVFATAVLAQVEQTDRDAERGLRTLRWCNAGHPPPVLLSPDGSARPLATEPDLMLGVGSVERSDHTVALEPGASVVFYTDGLIERRGVGLGESLRWLTTILDGRQDLSAEDLCNHITAEVDPNAEDDIALLVLRAYDQNRPRPLHAGPEILPADLRTRT
jgi:serine phosphatase RsbU (regulator of sigma subunit)